MNFGNILGWLAAILTLILILPIVLQQWKSPQDKRISTRNFILILITALLWIIYGTQNSSPALVITNIIIFLACGILLLRP